MVDRAHLDALRPAGPVLWGVVREDARVVEGSEALLALLGTDGDLRESCHPHWSPGIDRLLAGASDGLTCGGAAADGTPFALRIDRVDGAPLTQTGIVVVARRAGGPVQRGRDPRPGAPDAGGDDRGVDSVLSHDLRGALRQASGFATVVLRGLPAAEAHRAPGAAGPTAGPSPVGEPSGDRSREHLATAIRSIAVADAIGDAVVRWLRLGDRYLTVERYELERLVGRAVAALAERRGDEAARVALAPDHRGLPVLVDLEVAATGLAELLGNAVAFWPGTGRIEVTARPQGRWCALEVRDRGGGLAVDDAEAAFAPGRVLQPRGGPGGVGMGLPIARLVARRHGGWCSLTSDGAGVTATMWVPLG